MARKRVAKKRVRVEETVSNENGNEETEGSSQIINKNGKRKVRRIDSDSENSQVKEKQEEAPNKVSEKKPSENTTKSDEEDIFSDNEKDKEENTSQSLVEKALEDLKSDEENEAGPSQPTLKLVPLRNLLNPDFVSPQKKSKQPIEIISSEDDDLECIELASAPSKVKNCKINLSKIPGKVNNFEKCYRVNSSDLTKIESSSDLDDFENMIETTKIHRKKIDIESSEDENIQHSRRHKTSQDSLEISSDDEDRIQTKSKKNKTLAVKKSSKVRKSSSDDLEIIDSDSQSLSEGLVLENKLRDRRKKFVDNKAFNELKCKVGTRKARQEASKSKKDAQVIDSDEDTENSSKIASTRPKRVIKKRKMSSSDEASDLDDQNGNDEVKSECSASENSIKNEQTDNSSEDEQPKKRKLKKSDTDSNGEEETVKTPSKKRRKRIKKMASSDEDDESQEKNKTGRKNIRKLIKNSGLDVTTKEAAKIERERKQRIEERQKLYNQFYDERPEEIKEITQLILDFDEDTKKPLLEVDKNLVKKLKPHQAKGVKFMWDACFESIERCGNDDGSGCILAHCMGLGKTLQVITLVHTLLTNEDVGLSRVLVVCPLSTVLNWVNEFNIWLKGVKGKEDVEVYEINKLKNNVDRANKLMEWHNEGGVMILSYDMFRNLTSDTNRIKKKVRESLQTSLLTPGPDLVICDEGHLLKNEKTSISKAMMKITTRRRIVLTGTPLQNNLKEYYCMVQFVKPNLLGKYTEYMNRFVNPITNGQYTDSTEYDIQLMRRRAHVLHKLLDGCVQRRDYNVLAPFLPPKHEYVISLKLTPMQVKLYKYYMENKARQNEDNGARKGSILFQDFQNLQRIWTAPLVLRYNSNRYEIEMQRRRDLADELEDEEGSLKNFIDDDEDTAESTASSSSNSDVESISDGSIHSDEKKKKKKKNKTFVPLPRRTRAMAAECPIEEEEEEPKEVIRKENPTEWWMQICPEEELENIEHSSKLTLLFSILEECEAIGDKLLVFSQSLYSLDVIEHFLNLIDERTQNNTQSTFTGSWSKGLDYFRLDGSTPVEARNNYCKIFNNPENTQARLFLISTRAGGLGINLVAANRVIIFDVSWNPSHDIQSIFRIYRFGQTKPCYVYRFLALGTMEEKIYERQVTKQAISKRVIDEQQIDRHYNQNDLLELYKYDLEPEEERILPILPKDRLFAEMIKKYEDTVYKYHEHDTLLENKEEEMLNEEERKQAWEEFESEKNRPQYSAMYPYPMQHQRPTTGPVTSNSVYGIRTDILLKLLSLKIQLDHPNVNEAGMKAAIPLMMQELYRQMEIGDLTLYGQLHSLSSSLEVPTNYGGQFRVNEDQLNQAYRGSISNGSNGPSTSFASSNYQQQMIEQRMQQMRAQQIRSDSPPRIVGSVIEID